MTSSNVIVIYGISGSQYVAKVIAALESRNIVHYVSFVSLDPAKRRKELPGKTILVPQMSFNGEIIEDSEAILHYLDDKLGTNFYPANASELSLRVDEGLALYVLYYNWVDPEGYERSMRRAISGHFPGCVPSCLSGAITDSLTSSKRKEFKTKVMSGMGLSEEGLQDEDKIRTGLVEELQYFQRLLKSEDQVYLIEGTESPTAADVAVYGQIERLLERVGDSDVYGSLPVLMQDARLSRLLKWRSNMRQHCPLVFKGKRPPKLA